MKRGVKRKDFLGGFVGNLNRYSGRCIGVVDNKVVAIGRDALETFEKIKEKFPNKKEGIGIYYIPTKEEVVTALWNSLI